MDQTRGEHVEFARVYIDAVEQGIERTVGKRAAEGGFVKVVLQTVNDLRAGLCVHNVPQLGLGGVHLNGETVVCVDEFDQHGKIVPAPEIFSQCHACVFAVRDDAHAVGMYGQLPRLRQTRCRAVVLVKIGDETGAAPDNVLVNRLEPHGIQISFLHGKTVLP